MNRCTFCGIEREEDTRVVGGYTILRSCYSCEEEINETEED